MILKDLDSLDAACVLCRQTKPRQDLDRLLWCETCVADAQGWAVSRSWYVGFVVALALALWIWLSVQPSRLVIGGWVGTVAAAFYMSARIAREVLYGFARMRRRAADLEAVPKEPAE